MLKNFKIGSRLSLGFGIIMVLMLIVGGYSLTVISSLNDDIEQLVSVKMLQLDQAYQINDHLSNSR